MKKLDQILINVLKVKEQDLYDGLSMEDVVLWDSLKHMELIVTLENDLGIELSTNDIMAMTSINAIRSVVERLTGRV